ncbi:NAD(+)/NADH kinase [Nonomuraea wenchangensis]
MRASSGRPHFTVGLVVHPSRSVLDSIRLITRYAGRSGAAVIARWCDAERVGPDVVTVAPEEFADRVDVLISLGGDGTMLGAMRLVVGRGVPVLGVNHGNLGFLIEVGPQELEPALDRLAEGRYTLEPHSCLEAGDSRAFNDIVIAAAEPLSSLTLALEVNGLRHGLGKDDHIVLRNPSGEVPLIFSVDGTSAGPLQPGAELSVRLRTEAVDVVRFDADTHAQRNRVKLSLLDLPLRRDQLVELIPQPLRDQAERLRRG